MFLFNIYHVIRTNEFRKYWMQDGRTNEADFSEETPLLKEKGNICLFPNGFPLVIPQRYVLGIMGFLAVVNAYAMRVSLSVAITEMVVPHAAAGAQPEPPDACPRPPSHNGTTFTIANPATLYPWTDTQQGLILSAFYWGYVLTHIPGGMVAERFGGKHVLGGGILGTAVLTFITPWVLHTTDGDWVRFAALRFLEGLGEGTTFPALSVLLAKWVPEHERSRIGTLVFAGSQIGTIVANSVSGALIAATRGWAAVFHAFGAAGVAWALLWTALCHNDPEGHPFIGEGERAYLRQHVRHVSKGPRRTPWRPILGSAPLWALVAAQIGHDWGFFTMVTDLPKYMKDVLQFNVKQNGLWSSLPYVLMWLVSMGSGWACDYLVRNGHFRRTFARKFFTTIAAMGPAVFIVLASYSGCERTLAVAMFTIAMGFMGTFYCGMKVNALDLSPNFAGTLMAIVNGCGAVTGIIVPYLVGALTGNHTLAQWRLVFWIAFGVFALSNLVYVLFASGEVQDWNDCECDNKNQSVINEKP